MTEGRFPNSLKTKRTSENDWELLERRVLRPRQVTRRSCPLRLQASL